MEKKIIIYFYSEVLTSGEFTAEKMPFVRCKEARVFKASNYILFKKLGGLFIQDYFTEKNKHIRATFWNSENGYSNWCQSSHVVKYLQLRSQYQRSNNIVEKTEGPLLAMHYD